MGSAPSQILRGWPPSPCGCSPVSCSSSVRWLHTLEYSAKASSCLFHSSFSPVRSRQIRRTREKTLHIGLEFLQIIIARLTSSSLYPFHQCFFSSMPSTGLHTSTSGNDYWYIYLKLQFSAHLQNNHMIILWQLVSINSPKISTSIAFQSQPVAFVVQSLLSTLVFGQTNLVL